MCVAEEGDRRAHFEPPPGFANQTFLGKQGGVCRSKNRSARLCGSDEAQEIGDGAGPDERTPEPTHVWIRGQETIGRVGPEQWADRWPLSGRGSHGARSARTGGSSRWRTGIATGAFGRYRRHTR